MAGGEALLGGAVAGGTECVEETWSEFEFAGEEAARGLLATVWEIGHSKVLLEFVHKKLGFEIKQKGPKAVNLSICKISNPTGCL